MTKREDFIRIWNKEGPARAGAGFPSCRDGLWRCRDRQEGPDRDCMELRPLSRCAQRLGEGARCQPVLCRFSFQRPPKIIATRCSVLAHRPSELRFWIAAVLSTSGSSFLSPTGILGRHSVNISLQVESVEYFRSYRSFQKVSGHPAVLASARILHPLRSDQARRNVRSESFLLASRGDTDRTIGGSRRLCPPQGKRVASAHLFVGVFPIAEVDCFARELVPADENESNLNDVDRGLPEGRSCFARFGLGDGFCVDFDDVEVSTLPWAMGQIRRNGLVALSHAAYYDRQQDLKDASGTSVTALRLSQRPRWWQRLFWTFCPRLRPGSALTR